MSKQTGLSAQQTLAAPAAKGIGSGDRRGLLARVHTFDSLKERSYRWLWLGMLGAFAGMQMQMLARGWLVVDKLDGSALDLGIVTSSSGVPLLLLSLFGGVISDRFPKRNLLVVTQTCNAIIALLVAVLIVTDLVQIWHMIVAAVLTGTVFAFNMPGRQSLIPELVSKDKLSNAIALNAAGMNLNRIIAPGVAGVLVAFIGLSGVYFIVVGCYAFAAFTMLMVHPVRRTMQARTTSIIQDLKAGLKYAKSDSKIMNLLLLALVPLIFAHPYQALLPVFAKDILGVGSDGLGFLMGAVGVGAVTGTLALASLSNFRSRGVLMVALLVLLGLALVLFSQSGNLYLSMGALFLVGVGSMGYNALNHTLLLTTTTPEMRGRVTSIYMTSFGIMPLGVFPMTAAADAIGPPNALTIGAAGLILITLLLVLLRPQIRSLR